MRFLLVLALFAATLNARAATYLLLSQTNTFAAGITNQAKAYTDAHSGGSAPVGTVVATGTNAAGMVLTAEDGKGTNGVWSNPIWVTNMDGSISLMTPTNNVTQFRFKANGLVVTGDDTIANANMLARTNYYAQHAVEAYDAFGNFWYIDVIANHDTSGTNQSVFIDSENDNQTLFRLDPMNRLSGGPYIFDTGIDFSSGFLVQANNHTTNIFGIAFDGSIAAGTTNRWKTGDYFTNYVEAVVNGNATRLVAEDNSGDVTIPGTLNVNTATFTNFTATHLTVNDITSSNKLVSTSPTTTALTNGYAAAITNTWGIFTGNAQSVVDGSANLSAKGDIVTANIGTGTVTNNLSVALASGITNYIDFTYATRTNAIGVPITFSFATNGLTGYELSHTRYFLNTGGSNLTLTIPSGWKTNIAQTVCAALTNGVTTVMYVKAIGDTSSSALQTNVYVSFEYYK